MEAITVPQLVWLLVRVKRRQVGAIKTATVGGRFEPYRDRQGRNRVRRVKGTGERVFVPEHLLRRAGFEVFMPVEWRWERRAGYNVQKVRACYPKLIDWMFVALPLDDAGMANASWVKLMSMDVVRGVMGADGQPHVMKSHEVIGLMERWGVGGTLSPECYRMVKRRSDYEKGDVVTVNVGPFEGFEAKVTKADEKLVQALVVIFGRETPVTFRDEEVSLLHRGSPE